MAAMPFKAQRRTLEAGVRGRPPSAAAGIAQALEMASIISAVRARRRLRISLAREREFSAPARSLWLRPCAFMAKVRASTGSASSSGKWRASQAAARMVSTSSRSASGVPGWAPNSTSISSSTALWSSAFLIGLMSVILCLRYRENLDELPGIIDAQDQPEMAVRVGDGHPPLARIGRRRAEMPGDVAVALPGRGGAQTAFAVRVALPEVRQKMAAENVHEQKHSMFPSAGTRAIPNCGNKKYVARWNKTGA